MFDSRSLGHDEYVIEFRVIAGTAARLRPPCLTIKCTYVLGVLARSHSLTPWEERHLGGDLYPDPLLKRNLATHHYTWQLILSITCLPSSNDNRVVKKPAHCKYSYLRLWFLIGWGESNLQHIDTAPFNGITVKWQLCPHQSPWGLFYHAVNGFPSVRHNRSKRPDLFETSIF